MTFYHIYTEIETIHNCKGFKNLKNCNFCSHLYTLFPLQDFIGPLTNFVSCLTWFQSQSTFPVPQKAHVVEMKQHGQTSHVQYYRQVTK